jgi:putative transposase
MKASQLRSIRGYKRPRYRIGRPSLASPNQLQRQFTYYAPDQGSQFGSDEFARWCKDNRLSPSMSRRGNCWDNAVAESFFSSLKSELIQKRIYPTRAQAKSEIFKYIEEFYARRKSPWDNLVKCPKHLSQLSPLAFEQRQITL